MSSTARQLQGLHHSPCSSNSFPNVASSKLVSRRNQKPLIISAYRGSGRNNELRGCASKSPKHSAEISYMPNMFEDSSLAANGPLPCLPEANKIAGRSTAIHNLFSKWLTKLHNLSQPAEIVDGISRTSEQLEFSESPETKVSIQKMEWDRVWEVVSCYFSKLDATVKIIMIIFIPLYVAIRVLYGIEVLKELSPLWILGPLIVAFDIKMFQAISHLYAFSFKQAEIAIRSIPSAKKLTEATYTYISQKLVAMKSLDYKKVAKVKLGEILQWTENISVFFFTLLWPFYWRIVRFLTRANLI